MSSDERRVDEAVSWIQSELLDPVGTVTIVGELVDIRHSKAGAWGEITTRDDDLRPYRPVPMDRSLETCTAAPGRSIRYSV